MARVYLAAARREARKTGHLLLRARLTKPEGLKGEQAKDQAVERKALPVDRDPQLDVPLLQSAGQIPKRGLVVLGRWSQSPGIELPERWCRRGLAMIAPFSCKA